MKYRHQRAVAYSLTKRFNELNNLLDQVTYLLQGLEPGTSMPTTLTLEEIKTTVKSFMDSLSVKAPNIVSFALAYPDAGYLELLGRESDLLRTQLQTLKADADALRAVILNVKNMSQLTNLSGLITDEVPAIPPLAYYQNDVWRANSINDFLDASFYTLMGLDENTGQPHGLDDTAVKTKVRGYLIQIPNFQMTWPEYLKADVDNMVAVADYVMVNLDTLSFTALADYIGANVEKVPLFRRMWART